MGARVSTSKKEVSVDTRTAISKSTEIMTKNSTTTYSSTTNINKFKLVNKGEIKGKVDISQKIDVNKTIQARIDDSMTRDIQDTINNELKSQIDQTDKTSMGALFLGVGVTTSEDRSNLKKYFDLAIKTKITRENIQTVIDKTVNVNDGEILNEGIMTGDIKIDQDIACNIVITNVLNQVFDETNKLLVDNNTDLKVKQATENKFGGLEWAIALCCLFIVCLMCSSCAALLIFGLSPAGQQGAVVLANAGARRF